VRSFALSLSLSLCSSLRRWVFGIPLEATATVVLLLLLLPLFFPSLWNWRANAFSALSQTSLLGKTGNAQLRLTYPFKPPFRVIFCQQHCTFTLKRVHQDVSHLAPRILSIWSFNTAWRRARCKFFKKAIYYVRTYSTMNKSAFYILYFSREAF